MGTPREGAERIRQERTRQVRGLLILLAFILLGTVLHVGVRNVFLPGWWRVR
ncbi:hypothetical protein AciPR4_0271 [Terriglobus saanensis SP1PR4]|uniref:Uncharacterized protein n=1 Tax=Terriglobus saanensis (strain ATCC BAA-1853 / DSM 23119 / SP1PR4) TaxID=401053 RepID=E8V0P6_TERSS|nr:hypothetical protein AciPR4_0271 [Terriglobus saanensis SP1PR4]